MEVSRTRALRGPNLWSRNTAIEAIVRCTADECAVSQMAGFEARLRALFPAIGALLPEGSESDITLAEGDGLQATDERALEIVGKAAESEILLFDLGA